MMSFAVLGRSTDRTRLICAALNYLDRVGQKLGSILAFPGQDLDARSACLRFVAFRDTLDRILAGSGGHRSAFGLACTLPFDYVDMMLPGLGIRPSCETRSDAVDPDFVIGCPWRHHQAPENPEETMSRLNAAEPGGRDRATYTQIGSLPIYIAGEGKNRVELFQRHRRFINADITQASWREGVEVCRDLSGAHWLASWVNEHKVLVASTILYPEMALPIYRLCGVSVSSRRLATIHHYIDDSRNKQMELLVARVALQ